MYLQYFPPEGTFGARTVAVTGRRQTALAALKAGKLEIRPGQSNQLALLRRLAPDFINRQLWKASKALVPMDAG